MESVPILDLADVLLQAGMISQEQYDQAVLQTLPGQSIADVLLAQQVVTSRDLAIALSLHLNLPLIDLKRHRAQAQALALLSEDVAKRYNVIPLDIIEGELLLVMENPQDIRALEDISLRTGLRIRPAVGVREDIQEALRMYYRTRGEIERQLDQVEMAETPAPPLTTRLTFETLSQSPVARIIELLINQAVRDRASDIHITPQEQHLRIRYRIDGILHDMLTMPLAVHGPLISRIKVLANMNIAERRRPQDGQFVFEAENGEVDVRVATAETLYGEMAVLRILDKRLSLRNLDELGFLPEALATYKRLYSLPFGMLLVAGPTGAGKTTTLYATLNQLDRDENNIMTIEDPIEYKFDGINQIQVNRQAGITFATGLRAIMRLDPNIILVGEIRDRETAEIATQAALTGHLVLSSIHANDAVGAIYRMIDLGVEPFLLVSGMIGVVSQRLLRRVCPHCRMVATPSPEERLYYERELQVNIAQYYKGQGCNFCAGTGYMGRIGVFEVLTLTETMRRLVMRGAPADELLRQAQADGMIPMRRDGMIKVQQGITTPREVIHNVYSIQ